MTLKTPKLTFLHVLLIVLAVGALVRFAELQTAIAETTEPKAEKVEVAGSGGDEDKKDAAPEKEADAPAKEESVTVTDADVPNEEQLGGASYDVLQQLGERRKQLDAREKQLEQRDALLKAAKAEIAEKYKELDGVRAEIKKLLDQQSEAEEARLVSLVKVYEGMKAPEAANILNTLDTDVLMQVMSRMSERKMSAVLAQMNPDVAREITTKLARQRQLPEAAAAVSPAAPATPDANTVPVPPKP